jgi:hypothetical protein
VSRVGATRGIEEQLRTGREAVAMLHAVLSNQHGDDPTFLAAWRSARRVVAKPGAVRLPASVIALVPTPAPVAVAPVAVAPAWSPDVVTPAIPASAPATQGATQAA